MLFRHFLFLIATVVVFVFSAQGTIAASDAQQELAKRIAALSYRDEGLNAQIRKDFGYPQNYGRKITYLELNGCLGTIHNKAFVQEGAYDASWTRFELPLAVVQGPKKLRHAAREQIIILEFLNPAERIVRGGTISANWQVEWTQKVADMSISRQSFPSIGFKIKDDDGTKAKALIDAIMQYQSLYCSATS